MSKKKVPRHEEKETPWKTGVVGGTQLEREKYFCINDMEERASIYVPYIVERVIEGASYSEIAEELGINRSTLYAYRKTVAFNEFKERMIDDQLEDIMTVRSEGDLATAMRYREGLIKIAVPRKIEQTMEAGGTIEHRFVIVPPSEEQLAKAEDDVEEPR